MIKWLILIAIAGVVIVLAVKVLKTMMKIEKESEGKTSKRKKSNKNVATDSTPIDNGKEYVPLEPLGDIKETLPTDNTLPNIPAPSNNDISSKGFDDFDLNNEFNDFNPNDNFDFASSGFTDHADDEFFDYSRHMRNRKKRKPVDFDLEGEMADDFEYIPSSPDFSYLHNHRPPEKKPTLEKSLNEMPTELKVLMLSDIFDRKF